MLLTPPAGTVGAQETHARGVRPVRPVRLGPVALDPLTVQGAVDQVVGALDRGEGGLVITPNVDILRLLEDPGVADVAASASMLVCDGAPLLLAARLAGTPLPERVTGSQLVRGLSVVAAATGRSVTVVGGAPGVAAAAGERLAQTYPGLVVRGSVCPEWGFERDPAALAALVEEIAALAADLVFVGLGFPKQERLAMALRTAMPGTWFVGCGAAVEFIAETRRRAPRILQRLSMEWAFRLAQEPQRLGRRYLADLGYLGPLLVRSARTGARRRLSALVWEGRQRVPATAPEAPGERANPARRA